MVVNLGDNTCTADPIDSNTPQNISHEYVVVNHVLGIETNNVIRCTKSQWARKNKALYGHIHYELGFAAQRTKNKYDIANSVG